MTLGFWALLHHHRLAWNGLASDTRKTFDHSLLFIYPVSTQLNYRLEINSYVKRQQPTRTPANTA